jgi:hypothetical protein
MENKNEFLIDASKVLYLENSFIFSMVIEFIKHLDTDNLDNLYYEIIKDVENKELPKIFDLLSKVYFYITVLVNNKNPNYCSYKVIKYYISKEKVMLRIKLKEL